MTVENSTTIEGLNSSWPLPGDDVLEGDDHLRLLKSALKTQFPGALGDGFAVPITATEAEINFLAGVTSAIQTQIDAIVNSTVLASHVGQYIITNSAATPTVLGYEGTWTRLEDGVSIISGTPSPTPTGSWIRNLVASNIPLLNLFNGTTSENGRHSHSQPGTSAATGSRQWGNAARFDNMLSLTTGADGKHDHSVTGTVGEASPTDVDIKGRHITANVWLRTA